MRGRRPWALCLGGSWSCPGRFGLVSVTGVLGWWGTSSKPPDVWRTPRLGVWSGLISKVGIHANGKGENSSNGSDVWRKTPRLAMRSFGCFLVLEESKIYGSDSTGGQMMAPRVVA